MFLHNFQRRLAEAIVYPTEFRSLRILARRFSRVVRATGIPRRVPSPSPPEIGSELASRAGQKPIIASPNSKEILLVFTIPLRAIADADVRKFSGSPASNSLAKLHRVRLSNGQEPPAITKSPRWTSTAGPVRISWLFDEGQHSVEKNYRPDANC